MKPQNHKGVKNQPLQKIKDAALRGEIKLGPFGFGPAAATG